MSLSGGLGGLGLPGFKHVDRESIILCGSRSWNKVFFSWLSVIRLLRGKLTCEQIARQCMISNFDSYSGEIPLARL